MYYKIAIRYNAEHAGQALSIKKLLSNIPLQQEFALNVSLLPTIQEFILPSPVIVIGSSGGYVVVAETTCPSLEQAVIAYRNLMESLITSLTETQCENLKGTCYTVEGTLATPWYMLDGKGQAITIEDLAFGFGMQALNPAKQRELQ